LRAMVGSSARVSSRSAATVSGMGRTLDEPPVRPMAARQRAEGRG
jgi:hypothetical protein